MPLQTSMEKKVSSEAASTDLSSEDSKNCSDEPQSTEVSDTTIIDVCEDANEIVDTGEENDLSKDEQKKDDEEEKTKQKSVPRAKRKNKRSTRRKTNSGNYEENQKIMQEVRKAMELGKE